MMKLELSHNIISSNNLQDISSWGPHRRALEDRPEMAANSTPPPRRLSKWHELGTALKPLPTFVADPHCRFLRIVDPAERYTLARLVLQPEWIARDEPPCLQSADEESGRFPDRRSRRKPGFRYDEVLHRCFLAGRSCLGGTE